MSMIPTRRKAQVAAIALTFAAGSAAAQQPDPAALQRQIQSLQQQIDQLKSSLQQLQAAQPAPAPRAAPAPAMDHAGMSTAHAAPGSFFEVYGHVDVSIDSATKGISGMTYPVGTPAVGKLGWEAGISSNLSYIGVRGARKLGDTGLRGVFQLETQVDVSSTPGPSLIDNSVKGAWASRNSYLGVDGEFGAVKVGKTDAPYKLSTARMDPFSATVGDYNSVIGNTGGDNRAEFDTRLSHAIWYESPNWEGLRFSVLASPGQNRSNDNSIAASGEPDCTGGNQPPCNDGSFGDAFSVAFAYEAGPLYAIAAYELHKKVNRQGDEAAGGGPAPLGSVDVADEYAYKAGVQYRFPTNTTLDVIYERLVRKAPVADFNERTHTGYWVALTQKFGMADDFNLGWAHAAKAPGDPGVGPVDNETNMYAIGWKHHFDRQTTMYAVYATQRNHSGAHYDLGASGHGITTDCHDAENNCYFGGKLQAISVGGQYDF